MVSAIGVLVVLLLILRGTATLKLDDEPQLSELQNFPKHDGKNINLARELAEDYRPFSSCLLDDSTGLKMKKITESKNSNPTQVIEATFTEWLLGRGRKPVKWRTLLECLRKLSMHELMTEIVEEIADWKGKRDTLAEEHQQPVRKNHASTDDDRHPIKDKRQLFSALAEVGNWDALCTHLGATDTHMNALRNSIMDDMAKKEECLMQYFDSGMADWGHVVISVAEPPIGNIRLACKIAVQHMGMDMKECHTYLGIVRDEL